MRLERRLPIFFLIALLIFGCKAADDDSDGILTYQQAKGIVGNYVDSYSGTHTISASRWVNGAYGFSITKINSTDQYLIALNDAENTYNGSKYSRFDWATDSSNGDLYYCQTTYDEDSADDAEAVTAADSSKLTDGGCNGFDWSLLTLFSEITGEFRDSYSYPHSISTTRWVNGESGFTITKIDSTDNYLIAQNDSDNAWNADKYSRFDWTEDSNGDLYYCQIAYDKSSDSEAEAETGADANDLTSGCNGFGWSQLTTFSEVMGEYKDSYSYSHSISATRWINGTSGFTITKINSTDDYFIAKNDSDNAWNGDKYSRFDWTEDSNGDLYYCQIAYDKSSDSDAEAETGADTSDLTAGCNGFGWSQLITFSEATGEFTDNLSGAHTFSATRWDNGTYGYTITKINTTDDYFIALSDTDNAYNPSKYNRIDWAEDGNGDLYYCQIKADATSDSEAEAVTTADSNSLTDGGCGGFNWTALSDYPE